MKKIFLTIAIVLFACIGLLSFRTEAAGLDISFESSDGSNGSALLDDDFNTTEHFEAGTTLKLTTSSPIDSIYIKWDSIPSSWTLQDGSSQIACGQNGFLHEYVKLSGTSNTATITIPSGGATIADVYAFSAGELPDFVQIWEPSWDRADFLFISTHADDEALFFGGVIPNYTNEDKARVQVAYFTDFFQTESYRNHELLDGLWTMGVDHYPQLGKFYDNYSESLEEAEGQFNYDECFSYIVETIRRFKPQVLVTHDINGEYGHGGHRYVSKLVRDAIEVTLDASKDPNSASQYGTWDVPKTYLHLYTENPIEMDTRAPLSSFGGKTALQVAQEAYTKHKSQQWMWFYVDDGYDENGQPDGYEYSCAKYGLYRTTVGTDTGKDMLEHLTTYDVQDAQAAAAAAQQEESSVPAADSKQSGGKSSPVLILILCIVGALIILFLILFLVSKHKQKKQREEMAKREAARRRRAQQARRAQQGTSQQSRQQRGRDAQVRREQPQGRSQNASRVQRPASSGQQGQRRVRKPSDDPRYRDR